MMMYQDTVIQEKVSMIISQLGHTSTSISLALDSAKARDLKEENGNVIAGSEMDLLREEALEGLGLCRRIRWKSDYRS